MSFAVLSELRKRAAPGPRRLDLSDARADALRVARFLRGAAEFRVRPDDVFISSYPRSGTTWLQQVLHVLSHDGDSGFEHIADVVPWYERSLSLGQRRAADFERLPSPRIFKSHLPLAWLPRGARYVYALRDGRDVAASYHGLYRSHLGFEGDFVEFFERFLRGDLQYGSWFEHVAGWRAAAARRPDVHLVRYEQLLNDLPGQMRALDAFCGFGRGARRIEQLAPLCSFEAMKRAERRFDHATEARERRGHASGAFIRRGERGGYRAVFDELQLARFEAHARRAHRIRPRVRSLPAFLH